MDQITGGLLPLQHDKRDFKLGLAFGFQKLTDVPETDFVVSEPLVIKDQAASDMCTGYASTSSSEDQEGVELSPEYTFAKTKQLMGDWQGFGADLRATCKSHTKFGALEKNKSPFHYPDKERDFVANWTNWPESADTDATAHKKESFFEVDGPYDTFDNIRAALWKFKGEKRTILAGSLWSPDWLSAPQGRIPELYTPGNQGHAFKVFGQKNIEGKLYLVAQLSSGNSVGDKGLYYFPRSVVNREFTPYGQYMFQDVDPAKVRELQKSYIALLSYYIQLLKRALHYQFTN